MNGKKAKQARREREQQCFDKLAEVQDRREKVFIEIEAFEKEKGFVPGQIIKDAKMYSNYELYKLNGPWRKDKATVKIMRSTAKLMARNLKK